MRIHPSAIIAPEARLAEDVEVGAFAVIGAGVEIGPGTTIGRHATIDGDTVLGRENRIHPYAVVGSSPQDLSVHGEVGGLVLGDRNTVREFATINTGTWKGDNITRVGNDNLIMSCAHVAHDCILEDRIVMPNCVLLGGHVHVQSDVIFGGLVGVHHFVTVGRMAFVGGMARITKDVPPFLTVEGNPSKARCVNTIGLRRRGLSVESITALKDAYRLIFRAGIPRPRALAMLETQGNAVPEVDELVAFLRASQLGRQGRALEAHRATAVVPSAPHDPSEEART